MEKNFEVWQNPKYIQSKKRRNRIDRRRKV